jgi:hypothetical protein
MCPIGLDPVIFAQCNLAIFVDNIIVQGGLMKKKVLIIITLKFVKANIAQNRVAFSTVSVAYILG